MSSLEDPIDVGTEATTIRRRVVEILATLLDVPPDTLDIERSLREQGLDSAGATALVAQLGAELGRALSPVLVWQHPSIARLTAYLVEKQPANEGTSTISKRRDEPLAIVGMACRLPGGVSGPEDFWKLLMEGVDAISEVPADRWDVDEWYDPEGSPGTMNTRWGGFLDRVDGFEPAFFGISPREAEQMDPQQRLMLELSWEALEDTGTPPGSLRERAVGVFTGVVFNDYGTLQAQKGADGLTAHSSVGSVQAIVANRISYALGLQGPSLSVNTACSSSLVSVHLAAQSLRAGECQVALAGGVHLMLAPDTTVAVSSFGALSPDGRCHTFDARANGYVRGEGGGVLVLKPLTAALRDGDRVYAVLKGSAVNNDGASNGLTAPNPEAQVSVLREACGRAGVAPESVDYVELHGTGTKLGDPIEASALGAVYGQAEGREVALRVGSVKTNIGHLEAAAGIAGLMKASLCLYHKTHVPSLHFEEVNPHIDPEALGLEVLTQAGPWQRIGDRARRAGVSSFGFGGTNAHLLLEEGPEEAPSAHLLEVVSASGELELAPRGLVFVFGGLGPQWRGMGRRLYGGASAFRATLERCDAAFRPLAGWSLVEELFNPTSDLEEGDSHHLHNALIVACEIALAAQWRAWGVEPAAVIGHSIGEVAAAQVAGVLSVPDAMRVIHAIGVRYRATVEAGGVAMAFVALSAEDLAGEMSWSEGELKLVADTDPGASAVCGPEALMTETMEAWTAAGTFCRMLSRVRSHCAYVEPFIQDLVSHLDGLTPRPAQIPMWSTVTTERVEGMELDGAYWWRNMARPVRFREAIDALVSAGHRSFLELSPHGILGRSLEKTLQAAGVEGQVLTSQLRDEDGLETLHRVASTLYGQGVPVDVHAVTGRSPFAHEGPAQLLTLSSRSEGGLRAAAAAMAAHLEAVEANLCDIAWSSAMHREAHPHRLSVVALSRADAVSQLGAHLKGEAPRGVSAGRFRRGSGAGPVFVFAGQGGQWLGMGRELYAREPAFREALEAVDAAIQAHSAWSVLDQLHAPPEDSELSSVQVIQPAIFAMQVALAALWRSWGIEPAAVLGHSMGEVAAAHVSGALSLEDAVEVICTRSVLAHARASGAGSMAVVALDLPEAERRIAGYPGLAVAVYNAPGSVVVSGADEQLEALLEALEAAEVWCRRVKVDYASHSPQMDALLPELEARLAGLRPHEERVRFFSTVTVGDVPGETLDGGYWAQNLRRPVRFAPAVQALAAQGHTCFIEVSPHPVLVTAIRDNLSTVEVEGVVVTSTRREQPERAELLAGLGALWCAGVAVDWSGVHRDGGRRVALPKTVWQRQRYWLEPSESLAAPRRARGLGWHHRLRWIEVTPDPAELGEGVVAILLDEGGVGLALAQRLREAGCAVMTGCAPSSVHADEADLVFDLTHAQSFAGVREVLRTGDMSLAAVVNLLGLSASASDPREDEWLGGAALHLSRSLLQLERAPRLLTVTRGAWAVVPEDRVEQPGQGLLWGFVRSLAVEHPSLRPALLDLDARASVSDQAAAVEAALGFGPEENELAWRDGQWRAARLEASSPPAASPPRFVEEGSYLVTGGTGGLGRAACRWLVERGARHLVLVARRAPGPEAAAMLESLAAQGVDVALALADVSHERALAKALRAALEGRPPLRGVLHAAGVHRAQPLRELHAEGLRALLAPKLKGAWNLHRLTEQQELDFFVMYSSISGTVGFPGEAAYGAANAFLDGLAAYRQARGLPGLSVAWGPWAGSGMAVDDGLEDELRGIGLQPFGAGSGLAWLGMLMAGGADGVLAARVDWARFVATRGGAGPMLRALIPSEGGAPQPSRGAEESLWARIQAAPPAERAGVLAEGLEAELRRTLGLRAETAIDPDQGFFELGMDSLLAVDFVRRLTEALERPLPPMLSFDHPTLGQLTRHLRAQLLDGMEPSAPVSASLQGAALLGEPIAIIGVGLRLPGGVGTLESFWARLTEGFDAIGPVPSDRWGPEAQPDAPMLGGFLEDIGDFDTAFFRIAPVEARWIDPQQRLALEITWEALEQAGLPPESLEGSRTGVFLAGAPNQYLDWMGALGPGSVVGHGVIGNLASTLSGRLSFTLRTRGPCMSIDTGCSASLVAVHLACQSLRTGESELALAGGVNLILSPTLSVGMGRTGGLAEDGRCKTFDARADGFVRSEGAGLVVLKRLSDAERDGDRVLAVIRGSGVNHDGHSSGLTVPSGQAQAELVQTVIASSGLEAAHVGFVETHGTGTSLGDPIEVGALAATYGAAGERRAPMLLGALKSNIGHTEAAAGIAGLIKATLCVCHGAVPGNLHFMEPNPKLGLEQTPFVVPTTLTPWPEGYDRRLAGVSSFGVGGTNAHVVLEAPPTQAHDEGAEAPPPLPARPHVLLVSGRSARALQANAARLAQHLASGTDQPLGAVASSLCWHRQHHLHRGVVIAVSRAQAIARLEALAEGLEAPGVVVGEVVPGQRARLAFVCGGQGGQWAGMQERLCAREPVFQAAWEACLHAFEPFVEDPELLRAVSVAQPPQLGDASYAPARRADVVQPLIFAMQVSLAALWRSWGVEPDVLLGQSMGEVAAAHLCGALTLEDAARIICTRSRLARQMAEGRGGMAVTAMSGEDAELRLQAWTGRLSIAVYGGPEQTVLSGDREAVESLLVELEQEGVWARQVQVDYASHSPHMDALRVPLGDALAPTSPQASELDFFSTVDAALCPGESLDADYWVRNLREPVRLAQALQALMTAGRHHFVELGPHPVLASAVRENSAAVGQHPVSVGSMRRDQDGQETMLAALGALHCAGRPVDWSTVLGPKLPLVDLPTYAWQRKRYWIDYRLPGGDAAAIHAFVAEAAEDAEPEGVHLSLTALPEAERAEALRGQLVRLVNRTLGRPPEEVLTTATNLYDLGMDSILGLSLSRALATKFGVELPGTLVAQNPMFGELLQAVGASVASDGSLAPVRDEGPKQEGAAASRWLVRFQPRPHARLRVFAFPYAGGGANLYRGASAALPDDIEWIALRAPGRESREAEAPLEDIDTLLDALIPELLPELNRPFALFGFSAGGLMAYALARRLRDGGHPTPESLIVAACGAPQELLQHFDELQSPANIVASLEHDGVTSEEVLADPESREMIVRRMKADLSILSSYDHSHASTLPHPIIVYAGKDDETFPFSSMPAWIELSTGAVLFRVLPSGHHFIHSHPDALWSALRADLSAISGQC